MKVKNICKKANIAKGGITLLIENNSYCNLGCKYCYADKPRETSNESMDYETLEKIIRKSLENFKEVRFLWHGGEPLTQGISFYEKAIELQKKYKSEDSIVKNSMQTNGTLIDEKVADFIEENDVSIGVSIDGPKKVHNKTRTYKDGSGTFEDTMEGINLLKEKGLSPGALMVATKYSKGNEEEIYSFFREHEMSVKINPFYPAGEGKRKEEELALSPKEMGEIWIKIFDLWFNDGEYRININPFKQMIKGLQTGKMEDCNFIKGSCPYFFFFDPDGNVSICGEWSMDADINLGNINKDNFQELMASKSYIKMERRGELSDYHPDCKKCKWKEFCHSGCSHLSYEVENSIFEKDPFCKSRKMIFEHILNSIKENADIEIENPTIEQ